MTFKVRVALSFGLFVLLVVGLGAGLTMNSWREEKAFYSGRNALRSQFMAQEIDYFVNKKIKSVEAYVLLQEDLEKFAIEESDIVLQKKIEMWDKWVQAGEASPDELAQVKAIDEGLKSGETKVEAFLAQGNKRGAMKFVGEEYRTLAKQARDRLKEITAKKVQDAVEAERAMQRVVRQGHMTSIAGILLSMILGVVLAMSLYNSVMLPMKVLAVWSEQIAKGHLHVSLDIPGGGEMGRLAQNFNDMMHNLSRQHVSQVARERERLDEERERSRDLETQIKKRLEQQEKEEVNTLEDAVEGFREILDIMGAPPTPRDKKGKS